jgi:hypothetical protein
LQLQLQFRFPFPFAVAACDAATTQGSKLELALQL